MFTKNHYYFLEILQLCSVFQFSLPVVKTSKISIPNHNFIVFAKIAFFRIVIVKQISKAAISLETDKTFYCFQF